MKLRVGKKHKLVTGEQVAKELNSTSGPKAKVNNGRVVFKNNAIRFRFVFILLVLGLVLFGIYKIIKNQSDAPNANNDAIAEGGTTISDFETDSITSIVGSNGNSESKAVALYNAGRLKLSVEKYDQAAEYFKAIINLNDSHPIRESAMYQLVLIARKTNNNPMEQQYADMLGAEKLNEFENPPVLPGTQQ